MYDFVISCGHLENVGLRSYADLPNIHTSHYAKSKSHLSVSPKISSLESLRIQAQAYGEGYKISKILIFACKFEFYHW